MPPKTKEYIAHNVTAAKLQPGDRVKLNRFIAVWGGKPSDTGTVRSVKREGNYEYAVVAMDPYGSLAMPPADSLTKLETEER